VFSFHQQKNMSTLGEGGMVTTSDPKLHERLLSFRSLCCRTYDPKGKYLPIDESIEPMGNRYWLLDFADVGYNYRMTDAQAAVGLVQLTKLEKFNDRRREIADIYRRRLSRIPALGMPWVAPECTHAYHVFCIMIKPGFRLGKEDFMLVLYTLHQIKVWSHYMPIHMTTAYRNLGHRQGECPRTEALFHQYVSLPIHPRLTSEAIEYLLTSIEALA
jgi:dTDP-4-amino-4,6-dideoxygalactose transaminase